MNKLEKSERKNKKPLGEIPQRLSKMKRSVLS
jgi:hypothetical protein